ncbi:hypothetical protein ACFFX0_07545 [Citricoccus parietis]|uniref:Uncharacterized protein n=1 Tax=Citricoccus parietis TaxID=592307 RepID=A0ABV5FWI9_9MICC
MLLRRSRHHGTAWHGRPTPATRPAVDRSGRMDTRGHLSRPSPRTI